MSTIPTATAASLSPTQAALSAGAMPFNLDDIGFVPARTLATAQTAPDTRHITADPSPVSERTYDAGSLYGKGGQPSSKDVEQNALGDCYFDASLMALAERDPSAIKNAIQYDPKTGNYTVTLHEQHKSGWWVFGSSETRAVKVEVTQAELKDNLARQGGSTLDNADSTGAAWPAVMETAYAKLHDSNPANGLDQGYNAIANGGFPADAMYTLTGHKADQIDLGSNSWFMPPEVHEQSIFNQVQQALKDGHGVTLWTTPEDGKKQDGLVDNHVYTVERVYKNADGEMMVQLRNPWGDWKGQIEGVQTDGAVVTRKLSDLMSTGGGHAFNITGQ